eukprot:scaffold318579_cov19-Prasinocladus_malaysianus.AAC.1
MESQDRQTGSGRRIMAMSFGLEKRTQMAGSICPRGDMGGEPYLPPYLLGGERSSIALNSAQHHRRNCKVIIFVAITLIFKTQ